MDSLLQRLRGIIQTCTEIADRFRQSPLKDETQSLIAAAHDVGRAWSGSWLGYQATVYKRGLVPVAPGEHFDVSWGLMANPMVNQTVLWKEYSYDDVKNEILKRANVGNVDAYGPLFEETHDQLLECKRKSLALADALIGETPDSRISTVRDEIDAIREFTSRDKFFKVDLGSGRQYATHDDLATQQGFRAPHHLAFLYWLRERVSVETQAKLLREKLRYIEDYVSTKLEMNVSTRQKPQGTRVFIGHGRSPAWRDLKDLLVDRLRLEHEEFNRETPAGKSNKEQLLKMLDASCFAFLVLTAEDETAEGTMQARQNVVHEAGLFQGRLGFERAIILLEEGCDEFSNVQGIGQIRFPAGNIEAKSEEIRRVLEREGVLNAQQQSG